jgi:uncharacterized membrane protein
VFQESREKSRLRSHRVGDVSLVFVGRGGRIFLLLVGSIDMLFLESLLLCGIVLLLIASKGHLCHIAQRDVRRAGLLGQLLVRTR